MEQSYSFRIGQPPLSAFDLPPESAIALKDIIFNARGCLNRKIVRDISQTEANYRISFSNEVKDGAAADLRWQIPIIHGCTRSRIQSIFQDAGLLSGRHEEIHDLGVLISGTEDQRLHHDITT